MSDGAIGKDRSHAAEVAYDLVIRGATIYDGSGAEGAEGDIGVIGEEIAALGQFQGRGGVELDARGLCVSPGFIDVHSHDDFAAIYQPSLPFKLLQGVTTEVVGNCGMGAAPYSSAKALAQRFHPERSLPAYDGYPGYFAVLEAEPPSLNIAALVGHGTLRSAIMDGASRPASARELVELERLVEQGLAAGAVGVSTGLFYEPGRQATFEELTTLCRPLASRRLIYTTHLRNEADELLGAVREAIALGEATGVRVQLSHHKAHGKNNFGKVSASLGLVDSAVASGIDVALDVYPYTAGSTLLSALLESGAFEASHSPSLGMISGEDVVVASAPRAPDAVGRSIAELARSAGCSVLACANALCRAEPDSWVVVHALDEKDVRRVLEHKLSMVGSDGIPSLQGRPHPRLYGTFPRVLGRYVREQAVLRLPEAVHKLTGQAAQRFGLTKRGFIRPQYFADLVVFDKHTICDTASYSEPRRSPEGIVAVYVNGRAVVQQGQHTGARPGRVIRFPGE